MRAAATIAIAALACALTAGTAAAAQPPGVSEVYVTDYPYSTNPTPPSTATANKIVDTGRGVRLADEADGPGEQTDIDPTGQGYACRDIIVSANNQRLGAVAWYDLRLQVFFCYRAGAPDGSNYISYCFRKRWVANARFPWSFGSYIGWQAIGGQGTAFDRCGAWSQAVVKYEPPWCPVFCWETRTPQIKVVADSTGMILEARAWQT